jgi:hypothetical protein
MPLKESIRFIAPNTLIVRRRRRRRRQYLSGIVGKHEIKELQISAKFGTAHIFSKCEYKYKTYLTCEITLHLAQIVNI